MTVKTITLQITGMHCTSCAMNIDFELEDVDGVTESKTHYAKQVTQVSFDPEKTNPARFVDVIKSLGYDSILV